MQIESVYADRECVCVCMWRDRERGCVWREIEREYV